MDWKLQLKRRLPGIIIGLLTALVGASLMAAKNRLSDEEQFRAQMKSVKVLAPIDPPRLHQESIDIALAMYGIDVPPHVEYPRLDYSIVDRGLTTLDNSSKLKVTIGPSAFSSWALLGSTLAHELEVHCNQNFATIRLLDFLGLEGTENAEREAYRHELDHADRFGLTDDDQQSIIQTVQYFYPETPAHNSFSGRFSRSVGKWLARPFPTP